MVAAVPRDGGGTGHGTNLHPQSSQHHSRRSLFPTNRRRAELEPTTPKGLRTGRRLSAGPAGVAGGGRRGSVRRGPPSFTPPPAPAAAQLKGRIRGFLTAA